MRGLFKTFAYTLLCGRFNATNVFGLGAVADLEVEIIN